MADPTYTPPEVWQNDTENGGRFAGINRPTAGAREEKSLPVGEHDFQLYSLATPNGVKATIMFEELLRWLPVLGLDLFGVLGTLGCIVEQW